MGQTALLMGLLGETMVKLTHPCLSTDVSEIMCQSFAKSKSVVLEFDRRTDAVLWKLLLETRVIKSSDRRGKKDNYMNPCCQTRTMERKSQLKTIKVHFLVGFHLVGVVFPTSVVASVDEELLSSNERTCLMSEWHRQVLSSYEAFSGDEVTTCYTLSPWLLHLSGTSDAARGKDHISDWWTECTLLACWQIWWWFLSQQRAIMDFSLLSHEVLKPFLMSCLLLHLHLLYSASLLFLFHFVFYSISIRFLFDFYLPLPLHFCFGVVWIATVLHWSHDFSVFSLSPHPVLMWWSFVLLLLNVQSVAFVQGKHWRQYSCNKWFELRHCVLL